MMKAQSYEDNELHTEPARSPQNVGRISARCGWVSDHLGISLPLAEELGKCYTTYKFLSVP